MILAACDMTSPGGRSDSEDALAAAHGEGFSVPALADRPGGSGGLGLAARCRVETVAASLMRAPARTDAGLQGIVEDASRAVAPGNRGNRPAARGPPQEPEERLIFALGPRPAEEHDNCSMVAGMVMP
jgi:hypothetical protein